MEPETQPEDRSVLLMEDDGYCHFFLTRVLRLPGVRVVSAQKSSDALETAADTALDAILVNFQDRAEQELGAVRTLCEYNEVTSIIAVSERRDVDFALDVLRAGAFDYLTRPFNNAARVEKALQKAFAQSAERRADLEAGWEDAPVSGMIGKSKLLEELEKTIQQIGPLQVNVLISGESGTGKELIARAIHLESDRKKNPFIAVNCGAVPETLFESMFFGHEKGAFTGADQRGAGFLEKAQGGTLFLDEVSELTPKGQVALLRLLENQEFIPVGAAAPRKADVRIVAATNRMLEEVVEKKEFRADLYYRLNVVHLRSPALRRRPEDIVPLANHFLTRFCLKNRLNPIKLSQASAGLLEKYDWPGNVRELENLMEGLAATLPPGRNVITPKDVHQYSDKMKRNSGSDLPARDRAFAQKPHREAMAFLEAEYLQAVLKMHDGNVARAARHAGIHPVTFHRKIKKLRDAGADI